MLVYGRYEGTTRDHRGVRYDQRVPRISQRGGERGCRVAARHRDELAPGWVCEIISREGVGHVWLIDPEAKSLDELRLEGASWKLVATIGDSERVRAAIELELALLSWAR
jgi:Uma2 family endonuclease